MKFVLGLAAALAFVAVQTAAVPAMAQQQGGSTMETGSNASAGGSMSKGGGKMHGKKMKSKKKM